VFFLALANIAYNIAFPATKPEAVDSTKTNGHKVYEEPVQVND